MVPQYMTKPLGGTEIRINSKCVQDVYNFWGENYTAVTD